ncbi:MAG: VWA domain-containing protein [Spirochaetaceae bacterium]|nr:MAG: VWA domain-containing protein [Spirochaetaceae bacterium]
MCKKIVLLLVLATVLSPMGMAQEQAQNIDVIVMVDITWSLYESFQDIEQYLLGTLLNEVLHPGDTFHLIRFSDHTQVEITEVNLGSQTISSIRGKIAGLKNLRWQYGHYTDLLGAVGYLVKFTEERPASNKKVVILVTDGIHDPAPGTPVPENALALKEAFLKQAEQFKRPGWELHILRIPGKAPDSGAGTTQGSEETPFFEAFNKDFQNSVTDYTADKDRELLAQTAGLVQVIFPENVGEVGKEFDIPVKIANNSDIDVTLRLEKAISAGSDILISPGEIRVNRKSTADFAVPVRLPDSIAEGPGSLDVRLEASGAERILSLEGKIGLVYVPGKPYGLPLWFKSLPVFILIGLALIALLLLLFFFLRSRGISFSPLKLFRPGGAGKDYSFKTKQKYLYANGHHSYAIEMIVGMQNRQIGLRNVHRIPKNKSLIVGGGRSSFLIFLVPVPGNMAAIGYDGNKFTFTPRKREFFPELKGPISNCLGKKIIVKSKKGYVFDLTFEHYISPLDKINAIFHAVKSKTASGS